MIRAIVHKEGDRVYLEVPANDPTVVDLKNGEEIDVAFDTSTSVEMSDDEFDAMADRLIKEHREALDYLAK